MSQQGYFEHLSDADLVQQVRAEAVWFASSFGKPLMSDAVHNSGIRAALWALNAACAEYLRRHETPAATGRARA